MFADVSHLIADNRPRLAYGVAAADIDGDGLPELIVTGFGSANAVLDWQDGQLVDIADDVLADVGRRAISVAAADVDGDGLEELYVLNTDTFAGPKQLADRLFARAPGGGWRDLFSLASNTEWANLVAGRSVAALDRYGRGRYGFLVANYGGPMALFEIGAAGEEAAVEALVRDNAAVAGLGGMVAGGRGLVVAQILPSSRDEGRLDVFAVNEHTPNTLFRNEGDGTFVDVAPAYGVADADEHGRGVVAFDANGDELLDLAWANWEGPHRLCLQSELGLFGDVAPPAFARPSRARSLLAADFDNDGLPELFLNNIGEPNRLFHRRAGRWEEVNPGDLAEPDGLGTGAVAADVDGDGALELLVVHGEVAPQPLGLYKVIDATARHFLRVVPRTAAGAPARGAMVTACLSDGRRLLAQVDAGSGYLCQMEGVAHFGLGAESVAVDQVEVVWPGGARATIEQPGFDSVLTVDHPDRPRG